MKSKILSVLFALVLVLSFSLVTAVPVAAKVTVWNVPGDYNTIQAAIYDTANVQNGDTIMVAAGNHAGAIIDRPVIIKGKVGAVIVRGVPYKAGSSLTTAFRLDEGADGAEISHLIIQNDVGIGYFFAVFSRYIDDVYIHHLTITNSVQAITNYNGSGWNISHNIITGTITAGGGGIGIMINAWDGSLDETPDSTQANNNVIMRNYTEGVGDALTYSGPGILLSSGHGSYQAPGGTLTGNIVYKNRCIHTGVWGVGFEVDDVLYETSGVATIIDNSVIFNDLRGSTYPMLWYGDESVNTISRNFEDYGLQNRGEGDEGITPPEIFN